MVALSTAEAEFIAVSSMVQEVIYTRRLLEKLGFTQSDPTQIYEDNTTCIKWAGGAVGGSDRAKHIDLQEHFVHDIVGIHENISYTISYVQNTYDVVRK